MPRTLSRFSAINSVTLHLGSPSAAKGKMIIAYAHNIAFDITMKMIGTSHSFVRDGLRKENLSGFFAV